MARHMARRLGAFAVLATVAAACGTSTDSDGARPAPPAPSPATSTTAPASTTRTIEVELKGGNVVGGPRRESVSLGEQVRIRARSDVAEELHVHTYDVRREVPPGGSVELSFTATIPGRHEVEFEKSGRVALTLEVR